MITITSYIAGRGSIYLRVPKDVAENMGIPGDTVFIFSVVEGKNLKVLVYMVEGV